MLMLFFLCLDPALQPQSNPPITAKTTNGGALIGQADLGSKGQGLIEVNWNLLDALYQSPLNTQDPPHALLERWKTNASSGFQARFAQEKHISVLKKPLRSSGRLIFVPGEGLYRQQERPFSVEFWLDGERMAQREAGKALQSMALEREPVARAFANAFLSLFGGSLAQWSAHFECFFLEDQGTWLLGMRPKDPVLAKLIADLTLVVRAGLPQEILIRERNGDHTLDHLSEQALIPKADWPSLSALFHP